MFLLRIEKAKIDATSSPELWSACNLLRLYALDRNTFALSQEIAFIDGWRERAMHTDLVECEMNSDGDVVVKIPGMISEFHQLRCGLFDVNVGWLGPAYHGVALVTVRDTLVGDVAGNAT